MKKIIGGIVAIAAVAIALVFGIPKTGPKPVGTIYNPTQPGGGGASTSTANTFAGSQTFTGGATFNSTATFNSSTIFSVATNSILSANSSGLLTTTTISTGLSFSGNTLLNIGVTSLASGTGISFGNSTGSITITNAGVTSFNGSTGGVTGVGSLTGAGCVTNANTTGTITLSVTCGTGTVTTSSALTAFNFPYFSNTTGGLMGTSTIFFSSTTQSVSIGAATGTPAFFATSSPLYLSNTNIGTQNVTALTIDNGGGSTVQLGFIATTTGNNQSAILSLNGSGEFLFRTNGTAINTGSTRFKIQAGGDVVYGNATAAATYPGNVTASTTLVQSATKSMFSISGNAIVGGNASGTWLGMNADSGVNADLIDFQEGGAMKFKVSSSGVAQFASTLGFTTSSLPSVSTCGTNPTSTGSNAAAFITIGTGGITACTYNFSPIWVNKPVCVVSDSSSTDAVEITTLTTSSAILGFSLNITGGSVYMLCMGNPN